MSQSNGVNTSQIAACNTVSHSMTMWELSQELHKKAHIKRARVLTSGQQCSQQEQEIGSSSFQHSPLARTCLREVPITAAYLHINIMRSEVPWVSPPDAAGPVELLLRESLPPCATHVMIVVQRVCSTSRARLRSELTEK